MKEHGCVITSVSFKTSYLDVHLDQQHPKPLASAQKLDPLVYVLRLQGEVADGEVEGDTALTQNEVSHQPLLPLPGDLADVFEHGIPLLSGRDANTATDPMSI